MVASQPPHAPPRRRLGIGSEYSTATRRQEDVPKSPGSSVVTHTWGGVCGWFVIRVSGTPSGSCLYRRVIGRRSGGS